MENPASVVVDDGRRLEHEVLLGPPELVPEPCRRGKVDDRFESQTPGMLEEVVAARRTVTLGREPIRSQLALVVHMEEGRATAAWNDRRQEVAGFRRGDVCVNTGPFNGGRIKLWLYRLPPLVDEGL